MNFLSVPLALALLAASPHLSAQEARPASGVKQQMSAEEFRSAGLHKLDAGELAALDAWLQREVVQETANAVQQAREQGRQEVVRENRGFFDFGTTDPIESNIVGEFRGFAKGRTYTLANGQVWEQLDSASLAGVRLSDPKVSIKPGLMGVWFLRIQGYNTGAKVRRTE